MEFLPVELLVGEGETIKLEVPSNELSGSVRVPRMTSWVFGEKFTNAEGKPSFKIFGETKSIPSSNQLILLIRKGKNMADGVEVRTIANDLSEFGGGKFLFMNAAKVDIAGDAGGEKFALRPDAHTIVKPKPDPGGGLFQATFAFRRDDKPQPFFSSRWPVSDKTRGFIFFYHDPNTQQLRMHSIRDFLP